MARDEFDKKGLREVLNFGHTVGHALENLTGYKVFQHGEAVIWGMRFGLALSEIKGHLAPGQRALVDGFLKNISVPGWPKGITPHRLMGPISKDKKFRNGKVHFVLLRSVGRTVSDASVTAGDMSKAFHLLFPGGRS